MGPAACVTSSALERGVGVDVCAIDEPEALLRAALLASLGNGERRRVRVCRRTVGLKDLVGTAQFGIVPTERTAVHESGQRMSASSAAGGRRPPPGARRVERHGRTLVPHPLDGAAAGMTVRSNQARSR
jgi:hypothetical protein